MALKTQLCLWFDNNNGLEAAKFYTKLFKGKIIEIQKNDKNTTTHTKQPVGSPLCVDFSILNMRILALNGGPYFKLTPAASIMVLCNNQKEIDYYWKALSAVPQAEQCGWLQDKFGVSWQICPKNFSKLTDSKEGMAAMMEMKKLDMNVLKEIAKRNKK